MSLPATSITPKLLKLSIAVGLTLAGWTAAWFYASHKVEEATQKWLEAEQARGHKIDCARRTQGGFPFRIESHCLKPTLIITTTEAPLEAQLEQLHIVAQIWNPSHLIAEAEGPLKVTSQEAQLQVNWKLAQASLRKLGAQPEQLALVVDEITGTWDDLPFSSKKLELYTRPTEGGEASTRDLALSLSQSHLPHLAAEPADINLRATLTKVSTIKPAPFKKVLRQWADQKGIMTIHNLRWSQGKFLSQSQGSLSLSPEGYVEGTGMSKMVGFNDLLNLPEKSKGLATFGALFLGKPIDLEGRKGVEIKIEASPGHILLGLIKLSNINPVF